jgi:hypothetical protein
LLRNVRYSNRFRLNRCFGEVKERKKLVIL